MLNLKKIQSHRTREIAFDATLEDNLWIIRGAESVYCWNQNSGEIVWTQALDNDNLGGDKQVLVYHGIAITYAALGHKKGIALYGIRVVDGIVLWKKELSLTPTARGLVVTETGIGMIATDPEGKFYYLSFSPENGLVLEENSIGAYSILFQIASETIALGKNGIAKKKGLNSDWKSSNKTQVLDASKAENYLIVSSFATENDHDVFQLSQISLLQDGLENKVTIASDGGNIKLTAIKGGSHAVFVSGTEKGLTCVDFASGQVIWNTGAENGYTPRKAIEIDQYIIVVLQKPDKLNAIFILSKETGEILNELETMLSPRNIFLVGKYLLVTSGRGLESFEVSF